MNSGHDSKAPLPGSSRRQRTPQQAPTSSGGDSSGEPKRITTRGGRKRRSPLATFAQPSNTLKNYRGGNDHLVRTAAEGVPAPPQTFNKTLTFSLTNMESTQQSSSLLPHPSTYSGRQEFTFPEPAEVDKLPKEGLPTSVDVATCSKELFDEWLVAIVAGIPPSTASTASMRNGAVGPQKAQKNFFIRESILNNIFAIIQSAVDVLQRYRLELTYHKNLLEAYFCAVEEDSQDRKPEAPKFTVFHHSMREKVREQPVVKYQLNTEEICSRIDKLMFVVGRLEAIEGLNNSEENSLTDVGKDNHMRKQRINPFQIYEDDDVDNGDENNSDEDDLDAFPDGSAEKERILAKMRKSRLLKVLAKKSKGLELCLHLPTLPHEISSRLRNELVLPFSARVLSLKEISSKNGREDQIGSFVEWYVTKIVDPFAMSQLLRIVPMEYVVTTTCRLVSACDVNLSLRAAQALPDFSHVMIRAVREGRDEAFAQLALSPSVSFLAALHSPLPSTILFYAALLLGHLDVVRRVLSEGFFHSQALLVLLFFNANWATEDCAAYLRHQLQLCQEMSELRKQLQNRRLGTTVSGASSSRKAKVFQSPNSPPSPQSPHSPRSQFSTNVGNDSSRSSDMEKATPPKFSRSKEERVYDRIEASLKLFFSSDNDGAADVSIADQFIYGPLERLRVLLEIREQTHQQLYEFVTSRAPNAGSGTGSPAMAGKDPTVAMFQDLGVDVSGIGAVLRRELEALRWHSYFGGKNKTAAATGGIVDGLGNHPEPPKPPSTSDGLEEETRSHRKGKLDGTFGHLLRCKWMDGVVGHPLANVMLPAFSTVWLRRTDARSYLPISACSKPVLIRSDCFIDVSEDLMKKVRLYPEDEALEVKEVVEAEELRSERARTAIAYISATKRVEEVNKGNTAESKDGMYRVVAHSGRRNRQIRMAETYDDNYYFEAHVSVDYLLLGKDENRSDSIPSVGGMPRSQTTTKSSDDPSRTQEPSTNSLVIGFCSDNMESEVAGTVGDRVQPLGSRAGSGGVSLHVVGYRVLSEVIVENGTISEQEEEVVIKVMKHQNGKITPVNLPCTEKQQIPDLMSPMGETPLRQWSRGAPSTGDTTGRTTRSGNVRISCNNAEYSHGHRENHNNSTTSFDSASYVFFRLIRRRVVPNVYRSMSNSGSAATVSELNNSLEDGRLGPPPGTQFGLNTARSGSSRRSKADDEKIEEATFPLAHFITEKEFLEWESADRENLSPTVGGTESAFSSNAFSFNKEKETVGRIGSPQSFYSGDGSPLGDTKVENYGIFGSFGVVLGFFVDMRRNTVSLGINGIPLGILFPRVGVWPVTRLYPAATIQSSSSVVDQVLLSEESSNFRSTPPVLRFAFEFNDILGDQLLDARNHWEVGTSRVFARQHTPESNIPSSLHSPFAPEQPTTGEAMSRSEISLSQPGGTGVISFGSCPGTGISAQITNAQPQSMWPDAAVWLKGVKLFDKTYKFKQMLNVLSNAVVNESTRSDTEHPKDANKSGEKAASSPVGEEASGEGGDDAGNQSSSKTNVSEITTYQRTQSLLNHLSSGGFQDFIFFPSIHIRRRSDDGWNDLHHNGIAIIPERAVLSPLCAALACRQREMALSIASHFMTNMYHSTDIAIRQRRLALLGACALGYEDVVQVLLERFPIYEVLSLFSIQIQREELEVLRRDHRKRNVRMSKGYLLKDTSAVDSSVRGAKRLYAVTPINKLDPQKMYSSKATQYTPIHCAFLGGNHTKVINVLMNYLYLALSFKSHAQLSATYCKEFRDIEAAGKIFYVGQTYPHLKDAVNINSRAGESALLIATRLNNDLIAKRLLAFGAFPDCQDRISRAFALEIACANQFLPIAEALYATEAYNTPLMVNHAGVATPLCWCAINNIPEMIPPLLRSGADPMKGLDGNSPLLLAVTFKSERAALCLLENCRNTREHTSPDLERQKMPVINVDEVDSRTQCTALHIACELGLVEVVRALLRFHASLTIFTKATYVTPLHTAILNGKKQVSLTLLEYGKDQLRRGTSALDINAIDKNGNSPLHLAARAGMTNVVEYIVAQFSSEEMEQLSIHPRNDGRMMKPPPPVDFSRPNNQGKIPLLMAIQFHEVKCAELIAAYSYNKLVYPGGPVMEGTCLAVLQACAGRLDELVLLLMSYPQFQVHPTLKEDFMRSYTARRADFDRLEAKIQAEARKAKREAARLARQEERDYRYFPLSPEEENEEEDEEEEEEEEEEEKAVPPQAYVRPSISMFAKRGTRQRQTTNYTGALMSRTKAFAPGAKRISENYGSLARKPKTKLGEGRRRGTVRALEKAEAKQQGASQANHRRSFIRELFSRTRANIAPDVALKLLLRGFALPELFVMLEEVSTQSMVVGIQSPSAMVHGESLLGFLKEHFDVSIGPSNAVKFCRDVLEHIVTVFENMGSRSNSIPSWYHCRDKINDALRRYPPFCQQVIRVIRLYGRTDGCKRAIEDIRNAVSNQQHRHPLLREKYLLENRDGQVVVEEADKSTETHFSIDDWERRLTTPFKYTALQLVTCLGLAPLVSYFLSELHISPFFCPMQVGAVEEPNTWKESNKSWTGITTPSVVTSIPSGADDKGSRSESSGINFDYDMRRDSVPVLRDLYNLPEEKWCCTPYRLSIRSFHPATVAVFLRLFHHSDSTSASESHASLTQADRQKVQQNYRRNFGIDQEKVPLRSMAADYREPSWVDWRGNTPLQEVLADHLASRLSGDEMEDGDFTGDKRNHTGEQIHLHHLSSLEMYRGDIRTSARMIGKRLLKCGAATCGCFNLEGMDGWLIAVSLDGEGGRAATTLLLHHGGPLLGCPTVRQRSPPNTPPKKKSNSHGGYITNNAFKRDFLGEQPTADDATAAAETSFLSERDRIVEEILFRLPHLLGHWEEAGYGIPGSAPPEAFERLVFSSPIELPSRVDSPHHKEPSTTVAQNMIHHSAEMVGQESYDTTLHPAQETLGETLPPALKPECTGTPHLTMRSEVGKGNGSHNGTNGSQSSTPQFTCVVKDVLRKYTVFLLFACVEHNHTKLIDLLTLYSAVLSSAVRHPFTRDSLVIRLIKRAVEQLIFLKEVPVLQIDSSFTGEGLNALNLHEGSTFTITNGEVPFSVLVGTAVSEGFQRQHQVSETFDNAEIEKGTNNETEIMLEGTSGTGTLTQAYRDPYKIPTVRSLLEVAKDLLDNFDIGNRFEPSCDGETTLSLASITGHAPLVSRIVHLQAVQFTQAPYISPVTSRKLDLSHTTTLELQRSQTTSPVTANHLKMFESNPSESVMSSEASPMVLQPESLAERIPELPPPTLVETFNPSPAFTLSTSLEDPIVRTLLATRLYWGEEDAPTLYTLLNNIEGVDNQVAFLAMAYPNIHPLPALWLAAQYVSFAGVLLHSHECNIAFWANLLYAQFTGRLEELPIQGSIWNELLHVLLPRAPAIPVYLIHCHANEMEAIGARNSHISARRRAAESALGNSQMVPAETSKMDIHRLDSELHHIVPHKAYDRYPRLKVQQSSAAPVWRDGRLTDRTASERSGSISFNSTSQLTIKASSVNNWSYIVKRIDSFLKISAVGSAESLLSHGAPARAKNKKSEKNEKADKAVITVKPSKVRKSMGFCSEEVNISGISGTLLLDVIEVAARYDQADEVIELVHVQNLVVDIREAYTGKSSDSLLSDDQYSRDRDQAGILSRAVILSTCPTLSACSSIHSASSTLFTMERLLWKELIEVKHLDLIAVAAGSRRLLQRMYDDPMASPFLSTLRYDRINIATGIPEGMQVPTENPDEIRALPGYSENILLPGYLYSAQTKQHTGGASHSHFSEVHSSPFKGWIKEYVTSSFKALAQLRGDTTNSKGMLAATKPDEDEIDFCRNSTNRAAIGTPFDRNDIAKTTWGIGAAAQLLSIGFGTKTVKARAKMSIVEQVESPDGLLLEPMAPISGRDEESVGKKAPGLDKTNGFRSLPSKESGKFTAVLGSSPGIPDPKPVYQLFLQTDWVVHSSQVLRSPRPSVQTIDVLVLLLERRCALCSSALQLFFAASHYTNRWRSSSGEAITLNFQTRTHQDSLLHILVMNDQYQLTEYFLNYALYYVCKWSFDDPNLKPGVFSVREEYPNVWSTEESERGDSSTDNEMLSMVQAASNIHGGMHEKEPSTFLRIMLRLNRHGMTAFDYAHSPNMVQLLQRFGCVPPSYRPNPHTFTRALGLSTMLESDTHVTQKKYFQVPQLILTSENFLLLQDGENNTKINRQAGIKGNEQARIRYEKSLLAAFNNVAMGKKSDDVVEEEAPSKSTARSSKTRGKDPESQAEASLLKHLLATQKQTGTIVLPLILNEDVSLLHLGLCAHDDALVQMYGVRRSNLQKKNSSGSDTDPSGDVTTEKQRKVLLPPIDDEENEENDLFSPYMLSILPPEMTNPNKDDPPPPRMKSPNSHRFNMTPGSSMKLPPIEASISPSVDLWRSGQLARPDSNESSKPELSYEKLKGQKSPPHSRATRALKVKAPLSQRDVINSLEKRQFIVYPLNLPPPQVVPQDTNEPQAEDVERPSVASLSSRPASMKKGKRGKAAASAAAMTEGVFLIKELALQNSNAEEVVEQTNEMNHAALMVSLTPMQLVLSSSKNIPMGTLTPQYCSIPAEKLDAYFALVSLPEDISTLALDHRHRAAKIMMEANNETDRIARNLLLYRNIANNPQAEDPSQQVVTVPVFQPDPFTISAARAVSLADILDEWMRQQELKNVKLGQTMTSSRSDASKRKSKVGSETAGHFKNSRSSSSARRSVHSKSLVGGSTAVPNQRVSIIDDKGNILKDGGAMLRPTTPEEPEVEEYTHTAKPVGGVPSPEQQSLMRVLLKQFSTSAGGKLSHDMGMGIAPNYNVETHGDAIAALHSKSSVKVFATEGK